MCLKLQKNLFRNVTYAISFIYNGIYLTGVLHRLFNLRHLLCAIEIKESGSLTAASNCMHLSQSALTQGIKKLENDIGFLLFDRTTSGMIATPVGERFLSRASRAFHHLYNFAASIYPADKNRRQSFARSVTAKQLQALVKIAETHSYTVAAERLKLSQPSLHKSIKNLEQLCSQTLLNRSPVGVEPTWRARQLARYASLFFVEIDQGLEELRESDGNMNGAIRIGSLPLSSSAIVPNAVLSLLEAYPLAQIRIIDGPYDEQLNALLHGQLDVIVGALRHPSPHADIAQYKLFDDPLCIVARANHFLAHVTDLSDQVLQELEWVVPSKGVPSRQVFDDIFASRKLPAPVKIIECSSLAAIRGILLNSDRVSLLPARQMDIEINSNLLTVCPASLPETQREIGLTVRKAWFPTSVQKHFLRIVESTHITKKDDLHANFANMQTS